MKNKKGFTLVELVIVIAVIAILASVLIPTFAGILERARENVAMQRAKLLCDEVISINEKYLTDNILDDCCFVVDDTYIYAYSNGTLVNTTSDIQISSIKDNYSIITQNNSGVILYIPKMNNDEVSNLTYKVDETTKTAMVLSGVSNIVGDLIIPEYIGKRCEVIEKVYEYDWSKFIKYINDISVGVQREGDHTSMERIYSKTFTVYQGTDKDNILKTANIKAGDIVDDEDVYNHNLTYYKIVESIETYFTNEDVYKVVAIGPAAFMNNDITSVSMPNTLERIEDGAFWGCELLIGELVIPESTKYIGDDIIMCSDNIQKVSIGDNIEYLGLDFLPYSTLNSMIANADLELYNGAYYLNNYRYLIEVDDENSVKDLVVHQNTKILASGCARWKFDLESVVIPDGVEVIGKYAFNGSSSLKSAVLPSTLKYFYDYVFYDCSSLTTISMTANNEYYKVENNSLIDLTKKSLLLSIDGYIPQNETIEIIGFSAFKRTNITELTIPNTVKTIEGEAFAYCSQLESVYIPDSVTKICQSAFASCTALTSLRLSENLEILDGHIFSFCESLTELTIPNSVKEILNQCFVYNTSLEKINFGNSVEVIGYNVFGNCSNLQNITLPESLKTIDDHAFGNTKISSITIPQNVSYIYGLSCFNPNYLTSINVDDGNEYYHSNNTSKSLIESKYKKLVFCLDGVIPQNENIEIIASYCFNKASSVTNLSTTTTIKELEEYCFSYSTITSIILPESIETIGYRAFYRCESLESIVLPNSITNIESGAFEGCSMLKSVDLPDNITIISSSMFNGCYNLQSVLVPEGVEIIQDYAFNYTRKLSAIDLPNSLKELGISVFSESGITQITIPENVEVISARAFYYCTKLDSVIFEGNIKRIENNAFYSCNITEIILPSSIEAIMISAFVYNDITVIKIPKSCTYIDKNVFYNCSNLISIEFEDPNNWVYYKDGVDSTEIDLSNETLNATYFKETYRDYIFEKKQ